MKKTVTRVELEICYTNLETKQLKLLRQVTWVEEYQAQHRNEMKLEKGKIL
jgi:hypothetical protein